MVTRPLFLLLPLLCLTACRRGSFQAHGFVASQGDRINTWQSAPQGCTRDAFDGPPSPNTSSILTLLWVRPGLRQPELDNLDTAPDAPMRLEFSHANAPGTSAAPAAPIVATLRTLRHAGITLDPRVCTTLHLDTHESAASDKSRPSLSGSFKLDCRAQQSHITATVAFERCSY